MIGAQSVLLSLLSRSLFGRTTDVSEADWDQVLKEAEVHSVVQLVYPFLNKKLLSAEQTKQWTERSFANLANNIGIIHNHELLSKCMKEKDIPLCHSQGLCFCFLLSCSFQ